MSEIIPNIETEQKIVEHSTANVTIISEITNPAQAIGQNANASKEDICNDNENSSEGENVSSQRTSQEENVLSQQLIVTKENNCEPFVEAKPIICKNCENLNTHLQNAFIKIKRVEENYGLLMHIRDDLEAKLDSAIKQKESARKEKESMVVRYATSEKTVLEQKQLKEQHEKRHKESVKEIEILQHKLSVMITEKARICQMLDNKCYELRSSHQELERAKSDLSALETKHKWCQNSLKNEIELRKESESKNETLYTKLQEASRKVEDVKSESQEAMKTFQYSQDNTAHVLDQQLKEQHAHLIMLRHERDDREQQVRNLHNELDRIQCKQKETLQENNELSLKIQNLERERLESKQKLRELRGCADQQRQDSADLNVKSVLLEQLKLQLKNEQDQLLACNEQRNLLKQRNSELEADMEACRVREAELLVFTQQLTDKNVRLQSEFTSMETKVQQLACEQAILKRSAREHETKYALIVSQLSEEKKNHLENVNKLTQELSERIKLCKALSLEVTDQKGENCVMKRKFDLTLRETNKELQQCRKKIEEYETSDNKSSSSSSTSLNTVENAKGCIEHAVETPEKVLDKQTLIEHIVKLQKISARKSEKLDFLEEHVNTLVTELQKKTRILQNYILREQAGTLSSNAMDKTKANLARRPGVMASMYNSRIADDNLTLELSLDINRKLQVVLEDTLLKNITLKENVDTLGAEIEKLNRLLKSET